MDITNREKIKETIKIIIDKELEKELRKVFFRQKKNRTSKGDMH